MLHITNGDSVTQSFRVIGLEGAYLAWLDVLHDGPVPAADSLERLSDVRARALSSFGWGTYEEIRAGFAARDAALAGFRAHDEVVLWFEHDLYDQLQLAQILDWFSGQEFGGTRVSLIQIDSYPGVEVFHGLDQLTGEQLARLLPGREPVTSEQLATARRAWGAFRAPDPAGLAELAGRALPGLPFLGTALRRFLEEYPSTGDGLSRMQREILEAAQSGARTPREIYALSQRYEECAWGDASVYLRMEALASGPDAALELQASGEYELTAAGRAILAGEADWAQSRGVDTWLGGVHLEGKEPAWRWDRAAGRLQRSPGSRFAGL